MIHSAIATVVLEPSVKSWGLMGCAKSNDIEPLLQ
jgi:hypothetical protein